MYFHLFSKALSTLSRTQEEANAIEDTLKAVKLHQKETNDEMMKLFTALTTRTNHLERVKANLGQQSSVLSAIRVCNSCRLNNKKPLELRYLWIETLAF